MSLLRLTLIAVLTASTLIASPVFAKPNNGAFNRSSDAAKMQLASDCRNFKERLAIEEADADSKSGTPEAKGPEESANAIFTAAQKRGCSWAQ